MAGCPGNLQRFSGRRHGRAGAARPAARRQCHAQDRPAAGAEIRRSCRQGPARGQDRMGRRERADPVALRAGHRRRARATARAARQCRCALCLYGRQRADAGAGSAGGSSRPRGRCGHPLECGDGRPLQPDLCAGRHRGRLVGPRGTAARRLCRQRCLCPDCRNPAVVGRRIGGAAAVFASGSHCLRRRPDAGGRQPERQRRRTDCLDARRRARCQCHALGCGGRERQP